MLHRCSWLHGMGYAAGRRPLLMQHRHLLLCHPQVPLHLSRAVLQMPGWGRHMQHTLGARSSSGVHFTRRCHWGQARGMWTGHESHRVVHGMVHGGHEGSRVDGCRHDRSRIVPPKGLRSDGEARRNGSRREVGCAVADWNWDNADASPRLHRVTCREPCSMHGCWPCSMHGCCAHHGRLQRARSTIE